MESKLATDSLTESTLDGQDQKWELSFKEAYWLLSHGFQFGLIEKIYDFLYGP